jgi:hypothetical protein
MTKRAFGAVAALCLLAGCVTTTPDTSTVTTWRGWNVAGMLPPLELVAVANRLQRKAASSSIFDHRPSPQLPGAASDAGLHRRARP